MECKFVAGDKVVCVDAGGDDGGYWDEGEAPIEGIIYTVSQVLKDNDDDIVLHLKEITRTKAACDTWDDPNLGYWARRFRPAEDIEQFRRIVAKVPSKIILEEVE